MTRALPPETAAAAPPGRRELAGPILYGALFTVVLPLALVLWARASARAVPLPALHSLPGGLAVLALGLALWLAAVRELVVRGQGLPMNAYPPRLRVATGPYRFLAHPLYAGAALVALGAALATGSASGLWLVLPTLVLGMVALVLGYERADLLRRLGPARTAPLLSLPPDTPEPARLLDRANVYLLVLLPWVITYDGVQLLGIPADAFPLVLPAESRWRVLEWTEALYASCYLMVPLVPLLLRTRAQLRRFALAGLLATALVGLLWLVIPVAAPHRSFQPHGWLGWALLQERAHSTGMAAFPSFHVLWALLAADALAQRSRAWAWTGWAWALAIAASSVTTGMHALADAVAAAAVFPLVRQPARSWQAVRAGAEALANSWHEWRLGGVRIINHGAYAGLSAGIGWWIIACAAAGQPRWAVATVALAGLLGAGIWAQALEASSGLLRPFGYYGAVFGGVAGALLAAGLGASAPVLLAATALAAPWMQAIGRARCLVQGCCHGGPAPADVGIVYRHPRSRVSYLAELAGRPLHATQVYSMASNLVLGLVLLRLWSLGAATTLIVGVYLIGNGLARFVEEAYRGEPQTPLLRGLRLYQWLAAASLLAGAIVTTLPAPAAPPARFDLGPLTLAGALLFALIAGAAMGVDAPSSNRRFSRLATGD